jgi:hypothetical protein
MNGAVARPACKGFGGHARLRLTGGVGTARDMGDTGRVGRHGSNWNGLMGPARGKGEKYLINLK